MPAKFSTVPNSAAARPGATSQPITPALFAALQHFSLGAGQAKALSRLTHILNDAVDIAPADGRLTTAASSSPAAAAQCPAVQF
jgi:hypothetical protein